MAEPRKQRVKYVGNSPRVMVPLPDGSEAVCDHGKSVAVEKAVAESLLAQDAWEDGAGVKATDEPEDENTDPKGKK